MNHGPISSRLWKYYFATVGIQKPARLGEKRSTGCSKRPSSKAAGESKPEAYPQGYVEDFDEPRTKLAEFFSIRNKGSYPSGRVERKVAPSCRRRSSHTMSSTQTAYLRVQFG